MKATVMYGPGDVRVENVPDSTILEPGRVFDFVTTIDGMPDGYRALDEREAIKTIIEF